MTTPALFETRFTGEAALDAPPSPGSVSGGSGGGGSGRDRPDVPVKSWPRLKVACPSCGGKRCKRKPDGSGVYCFRAMRWIPLTEALPLPAARATSPKLLEPTEDVAVLDASYRALLDALPLAPEHWVDLSRRGFTPLEIAELGYASLPSPRESNGAGVLVTRAKAFEAARQAAGTLAPRVPLVRDAERAACPAILVPVRDPDGAIVGVRLRLDEPGDSGKYRWGTGARARVHVARPAPGEPIRDPRLWITEGEIKADLAARRLGAVVLSLPGVSGVMRDAHEELGALVGALEPDGVEHPVDLPGVVIALDADLVKNRQVAQCQAALVERFAPGRPVYVATWPLEQAKGLDDLLALGLAPEITRVAGPEPEPEPEPPPDPVGEGLRNVVRDVVAGLGEHWPRRDGPGPRSSFAELADGPDVAHEAALALAGWLCEQGVPTRVAGALLRELAPDDADVIASTWARAARGERNAGQRALLTAMDRWEQAGPSAGGLPLLRSPRADVVLRVISWFLSTLRALGVLTEAPTSPEREARDREHARFTSVLDRLMLGLPDEHRWKGVLCRLGHCGDLAAMLDCPNCSTHYGRSVFRCESLACPYCADANWRVAVPYLKAELPATHQRLVVARVRLPADATYEAANTVAKSLRKQLRRATPELMIGLAPGLVIVLGGVAQPGQPARADYPAEDVLAAFRRVDSNAAVLPCRDAIDALAEIGRLRAAHVRRLVTRLEAELPPARAFAGAGADASAEFTGLAFVGGVYETCARLVEEIKADGWISRAKSVRSALGPKATTTLRWPGKKALRERLKSVAQDLRGAGASLGRCASCRTALVRSLIRVSTGEVFAEGLGFTPSYAEAQRRARRARGERVPDPVPKPRPQRPRRARE